jgi:hypothetical protein
MLDAKSLRNLDRQLRKLLTLLDELAPASKVLACARRIIDGCAGDDPNKCLIRPKWEQTWRDHAILARAWFWTTTYIDKRCVDALVDVFTEMVRFVLDSKTPSLHEQYAGHLRDRCREYLALRGYDVRKKFPRLNQEQQKALDYIKKSGPVGGKHVARHVGVSFEHFRRWVTKQGVLTAHGVRNDRNGAGYYWQSM